MSKYLALYIDACRKVMRLDLRNIDSIKELASCLPGVRHALMCCVCGRLLNAPMGIDPSTCHHYVCRSCVGGRMVYMKGGCGWCKNFDEFVANAHLSAVVDCFKQLCVYINGFLPSAMKGSPELDVVAAIIREAIGDGSQPHIASNAETQAQLDTSDACSVQVATPSEHLATSSKLNDEARRSRKRRCLHYSPEPTGKRSKAIKIVCQEVEEQPKTKDPVSSGSSQDRLIADVDSQLLSWSSSNIHSCDLPPSLEDESSFINTTYDDPQMVLLENAVLVEHDYNKFTTMVCDTAVSSTANETSSPTKSQKRQANAIRRSYSGKKSTVEKASPVRKLSLTIRQMSEREQIAGPVGPSKVMMSTSNSDGIVAKPAAQRRPKSSAAKVKVGCRCAMATPAPGKLTCCGQRCPCYAAFHGCSSSCKCRGCRNPRGDPVDVMSSVGASSSLPSLFDAAVSTVFSTTTREQQSRFLSEPFSCFGTG